MACDTKLFRLLRMLFYLMEGYPQTLENCVHFLQIRKPAFYNYCNELNAEGFDVKQKERNYRKLVAFLNQDQNHNNRSLIDSLDIQI
jgi:hypothetical protein